MKKNIQSKAFDPTDIVHYMDTVPILLAALMIAGVFCMYGFEGEYMMEIQSIPFVIVYGMFFCLSFGLLYYLSRVIRFLDRKVPWTEDWLNRLLHQFLRGIIVPMIILFLVQLFFNNILPDALRRSGLIYTDITIHGLTLLIINMSYTCCYYVVQYRRTELRRVSLEEWFSVERNSKEEVQSIDPDVKAVLDPKTELFIYEADHKIKKVSFDQVAYIYWSNKVGYVVTFDGDKLIATEQSSLKELHTTFKGHCRIINRNYMVSQSAIASCHEETNNYSITLLPDRSKRIELSKKRFKELQSWILEIVDIQTI